MKLPYLHYGIVYGMLNCTLWYCLRNVKLYLHCGIVYGMLNCTSAPVVGHTAPPNFDNIPTPCKLFPINVTSVMYMFISGNKARSYSL